MQEMIRVYKDKIIIMNIQIEVTSDKLKSRRHQLFFYLIKLILRFIKEEEKNISNLKKKANLLVKLLMSIGSQKINLIGMWRQKVGA